MIRSILFFFSVLWVSHATLAQHDKTRPPAAEQVSYRASARPDRVLLTLTQNPSQSFTVTWRTDSTVQAAWLEVAQADASPAFVEYKTKVEASYHAVTTHTGTVHYHRATVTGLSPHTLYGYRVGNGQQWSEWHHYRTAHAQPQPFTFVYLGDAQTKLYSLWSRAIRGAYQHAPHARLILHAGDLVNTANSDYEWAEWFAAGSFIHATVPAIACPGNHEYETSDAGKEISRFWKPQFGFPPNGPQGLEEQTYYLDYQGVRFISLNSNERIERQRDWLDSVLRSNPNQWTVVMFHHPVFSAARGRSNDRLIEQWKPLFDRYRVDLVLQGHDHTYARGQNLEAGVNTKSESTVYVVSVSGPKMYPITSTRWMKRAAENTQVFQVIEVSEKTLQYRALQVTGEVYDAFDLHKRKNKTNRLVEISPEVAQERMYQNTLTEKPR